MPTDSFITNHTKTAIAGYRRARLRLAAVGAVAALVASACGAGSADVTSSEEVEASVVTTTVDEPAETTDPGGATDERPLVMTTTNIWHDVVGAVVCGDLAEVEYVIPAGVDSHEYEPSLRDRARLAEADLIVVNGLDLEEGLMPTVDAVATSDGVAVFAITDNIPDLIEFDIEGDKDHGDDHGHGHSHEGDDDHGHEGDDDHGHDHDHDKDDDHGHGHDGDDPHIWFDPVRVAAVLAPLADTIATATGLDREALVACAETYRAALLETSEQMTEIFSIIPSERRLLVTTHESLGYLADRFDFEILGTVLPTSSPLAESNPADLEDLARTIERSGIPAVFAEAEISSAGLESLATRVGDVSVIALPTESLGEPGSPSATYLDFLLTVASTIAEALRP